MKGVILGLRQIRGEMDISPAKRLTPLVQGAQADDTARFTRYAALLGRLAGIDAVRVLAAGETAPPSAAAVVGNLTLLVPMQGLIDPAVELARLTKKQEKNQQEIKRALAKLENPSFVSNAPPEVVATERERIAQFEQVNASLARQIETVRGLVSP
jgi:valyl-tRNA synthetase